MPYQAIILDLGNVILDWNVEQILTSLPLVSQEKRLLKNELFAHQRWLDLDHGTVSEAEVVADISFSTNLSTDSVEVALTAAKHSLLTIEKSLQLMEHIRNQGINMYCLSNMSRETYTHIQHYEFFKHFNGIIISGIERCMKPDEAIFNLIIKRFALRPANTLFIDDSLHNIEAAQRLGIHSFHFKRSDKCYAEIRRLLS